jgi:uncharacterized Fe-S cluster-containing radical SAM superfamily protein
MVGELEYGEVRTQGSYLKYKPNCIRVRVDNPALTAQEINEIGELVARLINNTILSRHSWLLIVQVYKLKQELRGVDGVLVAIALKRFDEELLKEMTQDMGIFLNQLHSSFDDLKDEYHCIIRRLRHHKVVYVEQSLNNHNTWPIYAMDDFD